MQVRYRSRQDDRLHVMLVLVHIDITPPGIFDVKDARRTDRPVVDNVDKITEIIEIDRQVCSRSIAQELKMDHKTVLSHLRKVGFK
ncbi:hypothetical protein TNCV_514081 [Trichonephila clavipes]|nr:hypothetical protein TNCV_514081 [Trichonephila clavipes]